MAVQFLVGERDEGELLITPKRLKRVLANKFWNNVLHINILQRIGKVLIIYRIKKAQNFPKILKSVKDACSIYIF